jgi:predicted nucleic acid-binding Zn ribbon protein
MFRQSELSLKDAIEKLLQTYKLKSKVQEAQLVSAWESIMGKMIERHTRDLYIKNNKLFVKLDSAVIRQELMYARTTVLEKVNQELGANVITEVVFL